MSRLAMVLVVLAPVTVAACGGSEGGPRRADVRPEAAQAFPGATLISEDWVGEEHGAGIDGNDLSHVARLLLRYRLSEPAPAEAIVTFYDGNVLGDGRHACPTDVPQSTTFCRDVGSCARVLRLLHPSGGDGTLSSYSVDYAIGYDGSVGGHRGS